MAESLAEEHIVLLPVATALALCMVQQVAAAGRTQRSPRGGDLRVASTGLAI